MSGNASTLWGWGELSKVVAGAEHMVVRGECTYRRDWSGNPVGALGSGGGVVVGEHCEDSLEERIEIVTTEVRGAVINIQMGRGVLEASGSGRERGAGATHESGLRFRYFDRDDVVNPVFTLNGFSARLTVDGGIQAGRKFSEVTVVVEFEGAERGTFDG